MINVLELLLNFKSNKQSEYDVNMSPNEYDKDWVNQDHRILLKSIFSEMARNNVQPTFLTFNAILYSYFKIGAYQDCVNSFEFMKENLEIYYDPSTVSIMSKVYSKLGNVSKANAVSGLVEESLIDGDNITIGSQMDVLLSSGKYEKLRDIFLELDENRTDLGTRNLTIALRMFLKE